MKKIFGYLLLGAVILLALRYFTYAPEKREYMRRFVAWNLSDIGDYARFPSIEVKNAPPVFHFKNALREDLFGTLEYDVSGKKVKTSLDELNRTQESTAFIVIKDDGILYEKYFNGYARDSINTSFSSAKSFTSALVGIALAEEKIKSLDDHVIRYLPELKGRGLDGLTLRHLVTMGSGIRYTARTLFGTDIDLPSSDMPMVYYYPNLRNLALSVQPSGRPVGKFFYYNDFHPVLMGIILERTTGMSPAKYLEEKIWKHLGMEFPASWSVDSEEHKTVKMESGLNARAIDFAKFGRLYLERGRWNGKQIVPERWVMDSIRPDPSDTREWLNDNKFKERNGYYGYWWWGLKREKGLYDAMARGHLGQLIFIRPDKKVIIVRNGKSRASVDWWPGIFQQIADRL